MIEVSVVICTHNPKPAMMSEVMEGLRKQTLPQERWEIVLVDNQSIPPVADVVDMSWHRNARITIEAELGIAHARLRGIREARAKLLLFVDDDNCIAADYLECALQKSIEYPDVGVFGGKAIPQYEVPPPDWFSETEISLGCRDLGESIIRSQYQSKKVRLMQYPYYAPIGAGMVLRRSVGQRYAEEVAASPERRALGRTGQALLSGDDNDLVLTGIKEGWEIAYFPELVLRHLIPAGRLEQEYLEKMAYSSSRTWVVVLSVHGICPWGPIRPLTAWPRKVRAFFREAAWRSPLQRVRWLGACGQIDGRRDAFFLSES